MIPTYVTLTPCQEIRHSGLRFVGSWVASRSIDATLRHLFQLSSLPASSRLFRFFFPIFSVVPLFILV